jgi:alpha-beta hydrolase superfamily lysophospholipase
MKFEPRGIGLWQNTIVLTMAILLIMISDVPLRALATQTQSCPATHLWQDNQVKPQAVLLCIHGLGLYNQSFADFGKRMASLGVITYAMDVRGFGSWNQAASHKKVDFAACLADIKTNLNDIRAKHPNLPVFILGESMGGAIALHACALYPELVDGLISAVPAADRFQQKRTTFRVALHLMANPDKPIDMAGNIIKQVTRDQKLRQAIADDPMSRVQISPRELVHFEHFMEENHQMAKQIKNRPVLFVQGCRDRLIRPEATIKLYNELATQDRQLVLVPKAEHLIFEENQFSESVLKVVHSWIRAHLQKSPS